MRAHRDTRLCSSRQRNILLDDSSAHILRGPRKRPRGSRRSLRRKSLSAIRQLPDRTGTDGFRDLSRNGPIVRYPCTFVNPIPTLPGINWEETGLRIHEARCDYCRLEQHPVQPPQLPQQPPFFLSFRSLTMARPAADTRTANTMISPIVPPLYANADAGIRILVSSEHQAAKACQRRQRGNGHKAEAGLPRQ